jgi:hypothetical protein
MITFKQHVQAAEAVDLVRMEVLRLVYQQADQLAILSKNEAARRWRGSAALFRRFDESANGTLSLKEFTDGLKKQGMAAYQIGRCDNPNHATPTRPQPDHTPPPDGPSPGYVAQEAVLSKLFTQINAGKVHPDVISRSQRERTAAIRIQARSRGNTVRAPNESTCAAALFQIHGSPSTGPVPPIPRQVRSGLAPVVAAAATEQQSAAEVGTSAELMITAEKWIEFVSRIAPARRTKLRAIARRKMICDHKTYQITMFLSAILINVIFFIERWGPSLPSGKAEYWGSSQILTSIAVVNLFSGSEYTI